MNYLFIQTAFLGDLLLSVPTLKQLRYVDPKGHISLLCRKGYGGLIESLGLADKVYEMDKSNKQASLTELKSENFDIIICPHQSMTSHRIVKSIRAKQKIGYKNSWNYGYFTDNVKRKLIWPEAARQLQLLGPLSEDIHLKLEAFGEKLNTIPNWMSMHLRSLNWPVSEVQSLVDQKKPGLVIERNYVCLAPGSVWPTKRWGGDKFISVGTELVRQGLQVVLLGAPDERELCDKLASEIPNSQSLAGRLSVLESLKIISRSKAIVCNDSGAMHMASLVQVPSIAMFGPTVEELGYRPWNPKSKVMQVNDLLCRPCGQHGTKACPIGTHRCMTDINEKSVVEEVLAVLS